MNGPSLYELSAEYREAIEVLGDMDLPEEAVADTLEGLRGSLEDKALNCLRYAAHLDAVAAGQKAAIERMSARHKSAVRRAEQLRAYVLRCMQGAEVREIAGDDIAVKIQKGRMRTVIEDEQRVHTQWKKENTTWTPEKDRIGKAIDAGIQIEGARRERGPETLKVT